MLSGGAALGKALLASGVRRVWSSPGLPGVGRSSMSLIGAQALEAVNEEVATTMTLAGALLDGPGTALVCEDATPLLRVLGGFGLLNELRTSALMVELAAPELDARAALSDEAYLCQLEAADPSEIFHMVRLGSLLSQRAAMPVWLRLAERSLGRSDEVDVEAAEGGAAARAAFSRSAGPYRCVGDSRTYHRDKRARRLALVEPLVDLLCVEAAGNAVRGVVISGTLGVAAQARAQARQLPSLRLPAAWPLPRTRLIDFMRRRERVLVLEEGTPFLYHHLSSLAHEAQLTCRVESSGGAQLLESAGLDTLLGRFAGSSSSTGPEGVGLTRSEATWRAAAQAVAVLPDDEAEPWPLYFARTRAASRVPFAGHHALVHALRTLGRPAIVVSEPTSTLSMVAGDRLVDLEVETGSAAAAAAALADSTEVEERAGHGTPLCVAVVGEVGYCHSEMAGILDNALGRRDVLHVVVAPRAILPVAALEAQLRACGLLVASAALDDRELSAAFAYAASRTGPRALVCYGQG